MTDFNFPAIPADIYKEVCSRSLYTIDGVWFLAVEDKYGFDVAFEMNQAVWRRISPIVGKRLLKNMDMDGKPPLRAVMELIFADPMIHVHKPEVVTLTDSNAVLRFIECPIQVARIRDGKGVYNGVPGCSTPFEAYSELIDPRIKAKCNACAPNPENPEYWCEWELNLPQE
ncbi:DUF6125 family protein [Chloroflexota bacterium]